MCNIPNPLETNNWNTLIFKLTEITRKHQTYNTMHTFNKIQHNNNSGEENYEEMEHFLPLLLVCTRLISSRDNICSRLGQFGYFDKFSSDCSISLVHSTLCLARQITCSSKFLKTNHIFKMRESTWHTSVSS